MLKTVDQSKCIGCGTCHKICPLDVFRLEINPPLVSPCTAACPIHNNIRRIHYLLQMGKLDDAAKHMSEDNPLASITGRVCPHFCETECTRNHVDEAVNISAIEQYLGDYLLDTEVKLVPVRHIGAVAVIGSGPAGLACAYFLAAEGFRVTIFEARDEPGGMLRYGIPEFRLPSPVIGSVLRKLQKMGVVIMCNHALDSAFIINDLRRQGFRAVFMALGASRSKKLKVEGIEGENVQYGTDFLMGVRTGQVSNVKPKVVVIGGGDVAMDVGRTAVRLGAESVTMVALEDQQTLPAHKVNIDLARSEGISFIYSRGVRRISRTSGCLSGIELVRCFSVFDATGAFSPTFDEADCLRIAADEVIVAIGQEVDPCFLPNEILGTDSFITAAAGTCQTPIPNIFAAGDAVRGSSSVAEAIGGGKKAARAIMQYLGGLELEELSAKEVLITPPLPENAQVRRAVRHEKRVSEKGVGRSFSEKYKGLDLPTALAEADRCMTCGAKAKAVYTDDCMTCFACELNCPGQAIFVHPFKEVLPRSLRLIEP